MTGEGWPQDWESRVAGKGCPLCSGLGAGDTAHGVRVWVGERSEIHLARRSVVRGYCTVTWSGPHVADPIDLGPADANAYWADVRAVGSAIREVFQPVKINYLILGNLVPHLHTHVVPRYADDPAAGGPLAWEVLIDAPETTDAELHEQAARLRSVLQGDGDVSSGTYSPQHGDADASG